MVWYVLADIEKIFRDFKRVSGTVGNFSLNMLSSAEGVDELERQAGIMRSLLSAFSARVTILCENEIRGIDSQMDIVRLKSRCQG